MLKVKVGFIRNGKTVAFTVYSMDERFRCDSEIDTEMNFKASNGVCVISDKRPELDISSIFLRGHKKDEDDIVASHKFDTKKDAIEAISKYNEALEEWSNNWEGWEGEKDTYDDYYTITEF